MLLKIVSRFVFEGLSDAQPGCPSIGCPYILHPDECRADAYIIRDGRLCKDCDKCIPQGRLFSA